MLKFLLLGTRRHPNIGWHCMYGSLAGLLLVALFLGDVDTVTTVNLVTADVIICLTWAGIIWHRNHFVDVDEWRKFWEDSEL